MQAKAAIDAHALKVILGSFTLEIHGDEVEREGVKKFGMGQAFSYYEAFWKYHVVPATERPDTIRFRQNSDRVIQQLGQASYAVFKAMFTAEQFLEKIKANDLGGPGNLHFDIFIKFAGDALHNLTKLQEDVIGKGLGSTIPFNPDKTTWLNERAEIVAYRNALTHNGDIAVSIGPKDAQGRDIPNILDPSKVVKYFKRNPPTMLTWVETKLLYDADKSKFVPLIDACETLKKATYVFLQGTYSIFLKAIDPLFSTTAYQDRWGMTQIDYDNIINYSLTHAQFPVKQSTTSASFSPYSSP